MQNTKGNREDAVYLLAKAKAFEQKLSGFVAGSSAPPLHLREEIGSLLMFVFQSTL